MFNGQPVPAGYILLDPDIQAGNDGLQGYAEIENGHFDTITSSKGVTGGLYVARIHGFETDAEPKRLFEEFKKRVELTETANVLDIEVPSSVGTTTGEPLLPPT